MTTYTCIGGPLDGRGFTLAAIELNGEERSQLGEYRYAGKRRALFPSQSEPHRLIWDGLYEAEAE